MDMLYASSVKSNSMVDTLLLIFFTSFFCLSLTIAFYNVYTSKREREREGGKENSINL